ncbi:MAG: MerR family transcriptional regulator [Spirochaetota bacterium]
MKEEQTYRIGQLAKKANVTVRTVRYYESLGLLKSKERQEGNQRIFTEKDLVYLERIKQLKRYGLSLDEIAEIVRMGEQDVTGEKRRLELIKQYREKMSKAIQRRKGLDDLISELSWHIEQLEKVSDFQACPGEACATCDFYDMCEFKDVVYSRDSEVES